MKLSRLAPLALATVLPGCANLMFPSQEFLLGRDVWVITRNVTEYCRRVIQHGQRVGDKADDQFGFEADFKGGYVGENRKDSCTCNKGTDLSACHVVLGDGSTDSPVASVEVRPSNAGFRMDAQTSLPPFSSAYEYETTYTSPIALVKTSDQCSVGFVAGPDAKLQQDAEGTTEADMEACDFFREEFQKALGELMQQAQARP